MEYQQQQAVWTEGKIHKFVMAQRQGEMECPLLAWILCVPGQKLLIIHCIGVAPGGQSLWGLCSPTANVQDAVIVLMLEEWTHTVKPTLVKQTDAIKGHVDQTGKTLQTMPHAFPLHPAHLKLVLNSPPQSRQEMGRLVKMVLVATPTQPPKASANGCKQHVSTTPTTSKN